MTLRVGSAVRSELSLTDLSIPVGVVVCLHSRLAFFGAPAVNE